MAGEVGTISSADSIQSLGCGIPEVQSNSQQVGDMEAEENRHGSIHNDSVTAFEHYPMPPTQRYFWCE